MEFTEIEELKEQLLTCHLCEEEAFSEGVDFLTLPCPCQHTICEKCLRELLEERRHESPLCPWCRQQFALPESGKLPTFRFAAQLSDGLKSSSREAKELPDKFKNKETLTLLQKFDFKGSRFRFVCAGEAGIFYGYLRNSEGLSCLACINVSGDGTVTRFGSLFCSCHCNSSMMYNGEELFVINHTQACIEVYKNTNFVRSWKFTTGLILLKASIFPSPGNTLSVRMLVFGNCPHEPISLERHYSVDGVQLKCNIDSGAALVMDEDFPRTVYKDSCWILKDKHLWEIPMELSINTITYKKPVKHCKVGYVAEACRWRSDKFLFTSGRLVKVLDLEAIKTAHDSGVIASVGHTQRAVGRGPVVKASVHNLLSSVYQESDKLLVTDDDYVVVIGQNSSVAAYKLLQAGCTAKPVRISEAKIPGPVYPTYLDTLYTLWNICKRTLICLLKFILFSIVFLLIVVYMRFPAQEYFLSSLQGFMEWLQLQPCAAGT